MADRVSGKAVSWTFDGQTIPITKCTRKVTRKLADATDNGDYNSTTDLIYPTQLAVNVVTVYTWEGRYRKSVNPGLNSNAIYESNPGGVLASLSVDGTTVDGHGYFDISDYEQTEPIDDIVTYTCTATSNGQFTPNS